MIQFKWDKKSGWLLGGFEYLRADDIVAGAAVGTGPTFRTDQLAGGQHVPFAKLMSGTADDSAVIPGDATNGLFVNVKAAALPSGAATEATLAATSAKLPATLGQKVMSASMAVALSSDQSAIPINDGSGSITTDSAQLPASLGQKVMASSLAVALASDQGNIGINDGGTSLTIDSPQLPAALVSGRLSVDGSGVTQPVSLASVPSHPVTNAGTFAVQATLAAGATNIAKAEDSASADLDVGVPAMAVRKASPADTSSTDGDYEMLQMSGGRLWVDASGKTLTVNGSAVTQPISAASLPLPSGAATAAKQPALGTAGTPSADVITVQGAASMTALKVDGSAVTQPISAASLPLPSGAATSANQSTEITSLQLIDDIVLSEDAAHASGDKGVMALAVRKDVAAALAGTDGDYIPLTTDSTGALRVTGGGGGTQYTEDSAHASGDTGTLSLAVRRDANTSLVDTTGDYAPLQVDASGNLKVAIISGAGSGGTAMTDDSAFTPASSSVTPMGAVFDDTAPDSVDEGDIGAPRMSANRNLYNTIRDAAGNERGANVTAANALVVDGSAVTQPISGTVTANAGSGTMAVSLASVPSHPVTNDGTFATQIDGAALTALQLIDNLVLAEDAAHASADPGVQMLAVRKDTAAALAGTDGDYAPLEVDASGRLHVNVGALPASTNTIEVVGDAAHDAAIAGNPVRIAGRAATADYTAVANGDTADVLTTILGKQVVQLHSIPDNTWEYAAAAGGLVNTTEVTAKAAAGAGIRLYVSAIQVINSHATISTEIVVRDGTAGTVKHRGWAQAAGGGYALTFNPPLRFSANTLVSIGEVTATATTGVLVNLQGYSGAE